MRTITAAQQAVLDSGNQAEYVRVFVKDGGGVFRDLTTYPGFNAVKSVKWSEKVDDPHTVCRITLLREAYKLSLSPFMDDSALNKGWDPSASSVPLLALAREFYVEVAICAMDRPPASGDWIEVFRGRIDTLNAAAGYDIELAGRSLGGRLAQQFIKQERVYSYAATGGAAVPLLIWETQTDYFVGDYILPATRSTNGTGGDSPGYDKFFICTADGQSGVTEPDWSLATVPDGTTSYDYVGAPTTSGNPVEEIMQNILDDNLGAGDSAVTLYTPSSPLWMISQFVQQREFTLDAIRALANQIGWDLRYKWNGSAFVLTFYQPERTSPSVVFTFGPSDYLELGELAVDIAEIRNAWRVIFADKSDLWPDGTPKRKWVDVSDPTSIAKYGELWAEMQEDENSQIDSLTEATALAESALSDCAEPNASMATTLARGFPWLEVNDFLTFTANGLQFDSDLSLACTGYDQTFEADDNGKSHLKTTLALRGKPTIGARTHLVKTAHPLIQPKNKTVHKFQTYGGSTPYSKLTPTVGGVRIEIFKQPDKQALLQEFEIHLFPDPLGDLTPRPETLRAVTKSLAVEITDLDPGHSYLQGIVPRFFNDSKLLRGPIGPLNEFTPGRAQATHLEQGVSLGSYPLNGGFETRFNTSGMPDHWQIDAGTFGVDVEVMEDGNGISGNRYLRFYGANAPFVRAAKLPIINDHLTGERSSQLYRVYGWIKNAVGNDALNELQIFGFVYDYAGTLLGSLPLLGRPLTPYLTADTLPDTWQMIEGVFNLDLAAAGARTMDVCFNALYATGQHTVDIDELRIEAIGSPWYDMDSAYFTPFGQLPDLANSWAHYGGAEAPLQLRYDNVGRWSLRGVVGGGSTGVTITTGFDLCGCVPPYPVRWPVTTDTGLGELELLPNGELKLLSGGTTKVNINVSWETF